MLISTSILLLTFASLGFLITKKNARYMLSGFKQFHRFQGIPVFTSNKCEFG